MCAASEIDTSGIRRLVALTTNDELNALACQRYIEEFGREGVYHLAFKATHGRHESVPADRRGRDLIGSTATFDSLTERLGAEPVVKATKLTEQFDFDAYRGVHNGTAVPVFVVAASGRVTPFAAAADVQPKPGDTIISLVPQKTSGD